MSSYRSIMGDAVRRYREVLSVPVGSWGTIRDRFFAPQVGVFCALILLGAIRKEPLEVLLPKLLVVLLLALEYRLARPRPHYAHYGSLGMHLIMTLALILGSAWVFAIPLVSGVLLPISLTYIALFVLRIPWKISTVYSCIAMILLITYVSGASYESIGSREYAISGVWFSAQIFLSLVTLSFVRGREGSVSPSVRVRPVEYLSSSVPYGQDTALGAFVALTEAWSATRGALILKEGILQKYEGRIRVDAGMLEQELDGEQKILSRIDTTLMEVATRHLTVSVQRIFREFYPLLPSAFFVVKIPGESRLLLIVPLRGFARARKKIRELILRLHAVVSAIESSRQRSQQGEETTELFNAATHEVNNATQELLILANEGKLNTTLEGGISPLLERGLLSLSWLVSDTQVLRELLQADVAHIASEHVELRSVLSELRLFADWINARQTGSEVQFSSSDTWKESSLQILVKSREFFLAVMRYLILQGVRKGAPSLHFIVAEEGGHVLFRCMGGSSRLLAPFSIRVAESLAALSEGEFRCSTYRGSNQSISMHFKKSSAVRTHQRTHKESWVLVLEDSPAGGELLRRAVQAVGYSVELASTVQGGLQLLHSKGAPRAVLADVQLGEESSLKVLQRAEEIATGALSFLIVSGVSSLPDAYRTLRNRIIMLRKPVGRRVVLESVQALLSTNEDTRTQP